MTPNSSSANSAPSRRSFLASTAFAAVAVAGGAPLLTACGGSAETGEGATSGKSAKKLLPTYTPRNIVTPDIPSKNGSSAGFTGKVKLDELATAVPEKLGTGAKVKIMAPFWGTPPKQDCAYYTALNEATGVDVTWQNQDGNTYGEKIGAVLASSSIPDMLVVPGWELGGKVPSALVAKMLDLGPYLAGSEVKKYPNLAAIPSDAWQRGIFGGKLRGIPYPYSYVPNIAPFYRKDIFEEKGWEVPKSADEFLALAKEMTSKKAGVYGCDDMKWSSFNIFGSLGGSEKALGWKLDGDKLVYRVETDEYLEALEWTRKLYAAGVVHPDARAVSGDSSLRFTSGKVMMYNADITAWYGKTAEMVGSKTTPNFEMAAMDIFGHDGGDPKLYAGTPANMWAFIRKDAPKEVVENLLAASNYAAAPYGTREQMMVYYGVEGAHYTVKDGVPVKTERGNTEVLNAWSMLAGPASFIAHPDLPEVAKAQVEWQQRMGAFVTKPPFYGLTIVEPSRYANLSDQFEQLEDDFVRGNKKLSDVQQAISDWKSKGGDKLRDWYKKEILDKNGSAS
ncbi:extracellular solute-binding protein [Streptomyces himalayensis]|uniref:Extracellular solute-binding protein n=1 Tax=Streptomyces himalayensis subsp. himalayensis TaxID=2756131 RepID=A0A7W0DI85_9ACTN|nr:extracellular solute-binding protein [Streptomyces himalayensis]MBA2944844.1 extracellular solute-binding protein [Streptomyces himalayensis subsp. himalayensis]